MATNKELEVRVKELEARTKELEAEMNRVLAVLWDLGKTTGDKFTRPSTPGKYR